MRYIIDRFEGNMAVCEDENKEFVNINIAGLPDRVHQGDVILESSGVFVINEKETSQRKERIHKKMMDLFE